MTYNNKHTIGIWGFGIVGKSVYEFLKQHYPHNRITIIDTKKHEDVETILQTPTSLEQFLEDHDYIIPSPGIPLHTWAHYAHKWISELDIYAQHRKGPSLAITGTLGKTSITTAIQHLIPNSIAAGNIGYPMLAALQEHDEKVHVLEVSSFQLQYSKHYAPDIALFTNFYDNHLDHHTTSEEYFRAKCTIFAYQKTHQKSLVPCSLWKSIQPIISTQAKVLLLCSEPHHQHIEDTYVLHNKNIWFTSHQKPPVHILSLEKIPQFTYQENWLAISAAVHTYTQSTDLLQIATMPQQKHRLELCGTYNNSAIYNDSKSTVWQATQAALQSFSGKSCALFLGGYSKGTDRTPLIRSMQHRPLIVFAFGKEAHIIQSLCNQYAIICYEYDTLEAAVDKCFSMNPLPEIILFSPAGASFDLFKNYQQRGDVFKAIINDKIASLETKS